jgi:Zn-dependent M28 family amino/carboxypeptidase
VDLVDESRWFADVEALASFNRYTHNSGIDAARDWLVAELGTLPGLLITTPSFPIDGTTAYNVVATLPGLIRPDDWYIIGAHYDAISEDPQVAAPGAEDNASGCAGVLEMARIFTAYRPEATVLFICYSAEELGLWGSRDHVQDLIAAGDLDKIQAMLNLDMIGYTADPDLDCLLETEPFAAGLLDMFADAASQFTTLRIVTDLDACCSDHKPYLNNGVPALLTIEYDYFEYPYYHTTQDLPVHLDLDMAREILKMNVAAMAQMIGAPDPPIFSDDFESGDVSMWSESTP